MATKNEAAIDVTPGQAQWIVKRMVAERRIAAADVRSMLEGLGGEIADLERRLAALREARENAPVVPQAARSGSPSGNARKRKGGRRTKAPGHPRGIAGTLAVLLRSIPAAEHAAIASIRANQGIQAAIAAAKAAVKNAAR
jgi:hypothetical protein